jgi:hypothetical protein
MAASKLEAIMTQVQQLSPEDQLLLIKRVADLLVKEQQSAKPRHLVYGEYRDAPGPMSTEEDFRIAEWHPTEKDLNGPNSEPKRRE